jgi:long-chain acyl-CoA synthetase
MRAPNVSNYLENSALAHPGKTALIFDNEKSWTFKEVDETVNRIANGLLDIGIKKGDRVTLFLPNSPASIFFYFGVMKIGAIVNPLNLMLKERELSYIVDDCEPAVMVTAKEAAGEPLKVCNRPGAKVKKLIVVGGEDGNNILGYENWLAKSSDRFDAVGVDGDDVAAILYTSGTTGHPKGVMLTHANLWTNARHCADWAETTHRDTSVSSLPLFHSYALSHVVGELWMVGGTLVWQKRFDATATFEAMVTHKATCFMGVATMYYALVNHPQVDDYAKKIKLRYAITGAAVTPEPILRAWNDKFVPLSEGYGTTEAAPVVCINPVSPARGPQKANSCGIPLVPEIEMKAVDEDGREAARGEVGELLIRGPNIMKGYWGKPEATAEALAGGWYHSGDMVYQDEEGYYYVKDRKKDMIVRAAFNIYPKEIEDLLYTHPDIAEAQVLGIRDLVKGEEVVACIALKPGRSLTEEQVIKLCKDNIASYKAPKYVRFFESLPKTATGKLEKVSLRKIIEEEIGADY